jgi:ABC-type nickel/cobalt efflux system permease component RcnA
LGALHALEPGHGKTVVAAYLVGSHGTPRHALLLGLIVTLTHTAGVYALGLITLYASQYVVPERLYPWLGLISGLLVAALGVSLLWRRGVDLVRARRHVATPHTHAHDHPHPYAHAHAYSHTSPQHGMTPQEHARAHDHQHHGHHHAPLDGTVSFRQLLALGITGGIVPCPAALVVLLSAVALQRIGFGLLLIVAFSAGLALVLIAIGLMMLYAQRFMARWQGDGLLLQRWLPLTSAALITCFGLVMVVQAIGITGIL